MDVYKWKGKTIDDYAQFLKSYCVHTLSCKKQIQPEICIDESCEFNCSHCSLRSLMFFYGGKYGCPKGSWLTHLQSEHPIFVIKYAEIIAQLKPLNAPSKMVVLLG